MHYLQDMSRADLLFMAKQALVRARIYRQEATLLSDSRLLWGSFAWLDAEITSKHLQASGFREDAKLILQEVERQNGKAFIKGDFIGPLNYYLNGRNFRQWLAYDRLYENHSTFQGVDPE